MAQLKQEKKYTMGIDIGTGGVRVGLFTMAGEAVAFSTSEVRSYLPGPGDDRAGTAGLVECACGIYA